MGPGGLFDADDLFSGDEENDEYELSGTDSEMPQHTVSAGVAQVSRAPRRAEQTPKRRLRIRNMSRAMCDKMPNIVSMVLTAEDGRQIVYVRK